MEKDIGSYDRIAHAVLRPVLIVVGAASLADFLAVATDILELVIAVAALLVGAVPVTMAVTQKCPPNGPLGVGTYEGAAAAETESTGKPHAQ